MNVRWAVVFWVIIGMAGVQAAEGPQEQPQAPPSPKALEAMTLLESQDPFQRELGFLRLEALREPSTIATIRQYFHSRDPELRAESLRALAAIQGAEAVPQLLESLRTDQAERVRRATLLGLEPFQQSSPEILPAFLKALHDQDPKVRIAAVDIVSRIDDPRARAAVFTRNRREQDRDVRRVLNLAMKRLKPSP